MKSAKFILSSITILLSITANAYGMYDPKHGRWFQRDPIGYQDGMNLYEYVQSRPSSYTDPNGTAIYEGGEATLDCGIEIHQSPLCIIGGSGGGQYGHTWLRWGGGNPGQTADCPADYIHGPGAECQKNYVEIKWKVIQNKSGTFDDGNGNKKRSCSSASCSNIKKCLRRQIDELCPAESFDIKNNNCRIFVDEAMEKCCLKKGASFDWKPDMPFKYCCSSCANHETGV